MKNKCIQCGLCVRECDKLRNCITLAENGPVIKLEDCIACGHCVAVCPVDAIENPKAARVGFSYDFSKADPDKVENYLRSVRTVRNFKSELIPRETLTRLINIGRYPQTGSNTQGISYMVVEGREKMEELHKLYTELVDEYFPNDPTLAWHKGFVDRERVTGEDIIFRGASEMILALGDPTVGPIRKNAQFALTFISLLAPALGLGTCWVGMFEKLAANPEYSKRINEFLDMPKGKMVQGAMLVGIPEYRFRRMVERNPLDLEWR